MVPTAMEDHGYTVIRRLGQGGQGRVYEVEDRAGQICVLKQLPWVDKNDQERAYQEVQVLSTLRHPCIVPYLESFLARSMPSIPSEDVLCIVMSRCEHDLREECVRARESGIVAFPEESVLIWFTQLCWGLQHLHARKFLHRDLKPQNVLVLENGRVCLADFGLASNLEHSHDFRRSIVGTPAFMSPEMLEGRPYNCKTDQWALGCVLYEIMALEPPFAGCDSYAAIVVAVLQSGPTPAPAGYSQALSAVLEALLAKKPDARPSSAELLGSPILRDPFRALIVSCDEEARAASVNGMAQTLGKRSDSVTYESDFESCSESDDDTTPAPLRRTGTLSPPHEMQQRASNNTPSVCQLHQLHVEADALLHPRATADPLEEAVRVRAALESTLGGPENVDRALAFISDRKPLCAASDADEIVLQIEVYDLFGEEGINALPLLERCLLLESGYGDGGIHLDFADDEEW